MEVLSLCYNFSYTIAISLCNTKITELTTFVDITFSSMGTKSFFFPNIKLINTIQFKLQSTFPPSFLAGMLLLQFQAQEMPCLCFLSVALTRNVISPYKSLLAYFVNDSVIVGVGLVPLPTQTKSRQLICLSQSVFPQKLFSQTAHIFMIRPIQSFIRFMGLLPRLPPSPEILPSSGLTRPIRMVKEISLLLDSKARVWMREEARTSAVLVLTFSNATPQASTACLTQVLVSDEAASVVFLFPEPCY